MALMTPEQFEESLKKLEAEGVHERQAGGEHPGEPQYPDRSGGEQGQLRVGSGPQYKDIMTCYSPLINEVVNRYTHVSASIEDLVKKAEAGTFTAERLGTCIYRCVGYDAFHALAARPGRWTGNWAQSIIPRLSEYLEDGPEKRPLCGRRPHRAEGKAEQKDAGMARSLSFLERSWKRRTTASWCEEPRSTSAAPLPAMNWWCCRSPPTEGEEDYAVAFATPTDAEGITYVCQYTPYSAERDLAEDLEELGNPVFGQRETSMVIFDNVFVPWERVFHCGECPYSVKLVTRFARTHRMTCGGTCKVGFMNQIIGAAKLIQEYKGLEKAAHINEQLIEMVVLRETGRACGLAAAQNGGEEPPGSGVFFPDELMGNVAKLNICNAFWRAMALAGDIGGGLIVTMPSLKELKNPEVKDYVEEFYSFGSDEPTENIMKVHKLLQNWTAGLHGVGTWHGAGPVMAQKIMLQRVVNFEHEKDLVRKTLKLKDKKPAESVPITIIKDEKK